MPLRLLFFVWTITMSWAQLCAQGCSDAGFCSMGAMKPDQPYAKRAVIKVKSIEVSNYVGITRFKDYIIAQTLEANVAAKDHNSFQVKLPYTRTIGPMGEVAGLGDVTLSFTRLIWANAKWQLGGTIGAKIPTGDGNVEDAPGRTFPMYYQPSLGTYDFIAGISVKSSKWLIATGWQHTFNQNNSNFFWGPWGEVGKLEEARLYPTSINLRRGEDIMFRVERNWRFAKFNCALGLLEIYRINPEERTNPQDRQTREIVVDDIGTSKGSALTVIGSGGYNFTTRSGVQVIVGKRLLKRHLNADGLSRNWVFTVGYQFRF